MKRNIIVIVIKVFVILTYSISGNPCNADSIRVLNDFQSMRKHKIFVVAGKSRETSRLCAVLAYYEVGSGHLWPLIG